MIRNIRRTLSDPLFTKLVLRVTRDLFFLFGFAIAVYGIAMIHVPAAAIVAGLTLSALAYFSAPSEPPQ